MATSAAMPRRIIDIHNHLWGKDPSAVIDRMDALGIEKMLVLGLPEGLGCINDQVVAACAKYPKRLVGGLYADPLDGKKAIRDLEKYHDRGLRVVKICPNVGYHPDEPRVGPFFAKAAKLGIAILSHCGWEGGSGEHMVRREWAAYYSSPGQFEKLIRMYPEQIFIMAHMGGIPGLLEVISLAICAPNVYVDCTPGQGLWALETCGAIAGGIPPGKLVWGADYMPDKPFIERYRKALVKLGYGPHLDKIFYSNAQGIFEKLGVR